MPNTDRKFTSISRVVFDVVNDIMEMKASQPLGGQSFVNYASYTGATHDISVLMNAEYKDFRVTFTHTEPDKYHILQPSIFYRVNNSNVMASPEVTAFNTGRAVRMVRESPLPGVTSWILSAIDLAYGTHGADYTYYIKLFFRGTTSGTFTVDPL